MDESGDGEVNLDLILKTFNCVALRRPTLI